MGQSQSSLPSGKKYFVSYCKQHSVKESNIKILDSVELSNLLTGDLIGSVYKYKTHFLGYSVPSIKYENQRPLNLILKSIKLKNFDIKPRCYVVSLDNIKYFLSRFDVLIAGIIIDKKFAKGIFKVDIENKASDVILITGYTLDSLIIKTNWKLGELEIPFDFICNIKEIWNIDILSHEDKYLQELAEC
jgi:hypothetical protein